MRSEAVQASGLCCATRCTGVVTRAVHGTGLFYCNTGQADIVLLFAQIQLHMHKHVTEKSTSSRARQEHRVKAHPSSMASCRFLSGAEEKHAYKAH